MNQKQKPITVTPQWKVDSEIIKHALKVSIAIQNMESFHYLSEMDEDIAKLYELLDAKLKQTIGSVVVDSEVKS